MGAFCVPTVFHFHGAQASSGNAVLQLALDVIVPAEKTLSFLRGCIQIYSLTAVTDHSRDTALWQWKIFFTLRLAAGGFRQHGFFLFNKKAQDWIDESLRRRLEWDSGIFMSYAAVNLNNLKLSLTHSNPQEVAGILKSSLLWCWFIFFPWHFNL